MLKLKKFTAKNYTLFVTRIQTFTLNCFVKYFPILFWMAKNMIVLNGYRQRNQLNNITTIKTRVYTVFIQNNNIIMVTECSIREVKGGYWTNICNKFLIQCVNIKYKTCSLSIHLNRKETFAVLENH